MKKLGITSTIGRWIANFLLQRRQAVKVGGKVSSWSWVRSGVPQGSVLGPVLFLIFISDLGQELSPLEASILKYVDDTKLIKKITSSQDVEELQAALDSLYFWQAENNMTWNSGKFQALRLGSNNTLKEETLLFTDSMAQVIEPTEEVKDLGVLFASDATFKNQRRSAVRKTSNKTSWVLRTFRTRAPGPMRTLWRSLCQPHQDYASQLWSPVDSPGELAAQEAPLRSFTRRIVGLRDTPYWERLAECKLLSTDRRQERYKIIYAWKIIQGMVPNCGMTFSNPTGRRGRLFKLPSLSGSRALVRTLKERSFQTEGAKLFNSLPITIRNLDCTKSTFKARLDKFLEQLPDQPRTVGGNLPGAQDLQGNHSNSIKDWIRRLLLHEDEGEAEEEKAGSDQEEMEGREEVME